MYNNNNNNVFIIIIITVLFTEGNIFTKNRFQVSTPYHRVYQHSLSMCCVLIFMFVQIHTANKN